MQCNDDGNRGFPRSPGRRDRAENEWALRSPIEEGGLAGEETGDEDDEDAPADLVRRVQFAPVVERAAEAGARNEVEAKPAEKTDAATIFEASPEALAIRCRHPTRRLGKLPGNAPKGNESRNAQPQSGTRGYASESRAGSGTRAASGARAGHRYAGKYRAETISMPAASFERAALAHSSS